LMAIRALCTAAGVDQGGYCHTQVLGHKQCSPCSCQLDQPATSLKCSCKGGPHGMDLGRKMSQELSGHKCK
jgi:hypothetical protein